MGHHYDFLWNDLGQLIAGPLSDAIGRKRILFTGILIYFLGSLLCYFTQSFEWFLVGRFIQGVGVAGPYVATIQLCETNTVARKWRELPCDRTIKRLYLVLESCKE